MAHQEAPDHGARAPQAAQAVHVDRVAGADGGVNHVQRLCHLFWGGDAKVRDGHSEVLGLFAQPLGVRRRVLLLGQVEEEGDAGVEEAPETLAVAGFAPRARVRAGQQPAGDDPVGSGKDSFILER